MGKAYDIWQVTGLMKKIYNYEVKGKGPKPTEEEKKFIEQFVKDFRHARGRDQNFRKSYLHNTAFVL